MSRERFAYRDNLQDILEYFEGRRALSASDVRKYLGFRDNRTVKRRFPFKDGYISAPLLARCLSGGCEP